MVWFQCGKQEKRLPRSILMMMLNDKDTGAPLALMSANLVSAYRTGGIPGVGAKYLARKDAKVASVIGPGVMGKTSLAAFVSVCPHLDTVKSKAADRNPWIPLFPLSKRNCRRSKIFRSVKQWKKQCGTVISSVLPQRCVMMYLPSHISMGTGSKKVH